MQILTEIELNLKHPNINKIVHAKQNDKLTRYVSAKLMNGEQAWTPPAGALSTVRFRKSDGNAGFYDLDENEEPAVVYSGSTATITLAEEALTAPGPVVMEINIYTTDGEKLTTFAFVVMVEQGAVTDEEIISTDYFNVLTQQITSVIGKIDSVAGITAVAESVEYGEGTSVEVTGGTGTTDPYVLHFYIERGENGTDGASFNPRGYYSSSATYNKLDFVSYNNTAFVATRNGITGVTPSEESEDWQLLSTYLKVDSMELSYVLQSAAEFTGQAPVSGWQSTLPAAQGNTYLWIRTRTEFSDGTYFFTYVAARNGSDGSGSPGTLTPLMDGTAAAGTANAYSREDHVHPSDTTKLNIQQNVSDAGKFLVIGVDGAITAMSLQTWEGGSY